MSLIDVIKNGGDISEINLLIETNPDKNCVNTIDNNKSTPIIIAAQQGRLDITKLLISKSANLNSQNFEGTTALIASISGNHLDIAKELISSGCDLKIKDTHGMTALDYAQKLNLKEICEILYQKSTPSMKLEEEQTQMVIENSPKRGTKRTNEEIEEINNIQSEINLKRTKLDKLEKLKLELESKISSDQAKIHELKKEIENKKENFEKLDQTIQEFEISLLKLKEQKKIDAEAIEKSSQLLKQINEDAELNQKNLNECVNSIEKTKCLERIIKADLKTWSDEDTKKIFEEIEMVDWFEHFRNNKISAKDIGNLREIAFMRIPSSSKDKKIIKFGEVRYIKLVFQEISMKKEIPRIFDNPELDPSLVKSWTYKNVEKYFNQLKLNLVSKIVALNKINGLVLVNLQKDDLEAIDTEIWYESQEFWDQFSKNLPNINNDYSSISQKHENEIMKKEEITSPQKIQPTSQETILNFCLSPLSPSKNHHHHHAITTNSVLPPSTPTPTTTTPIPTSPTTTPTSTPPIATSTPPITNNTASRQSSCNLSSSPVQLNISRSPQKNLSPHKSTDIILISETVSDTITILENDRIERNQIVKPDPRIPKEFLCPISNMLMEDPVEAADGCIYERKSIEEWLQKGNNSPITCESIPNHLLKPVPEKAAAIKEWKKKENL